MRRLLASPPPHSRSLRSRLRAAVPLAEGDSFSSEPEGPRPEGREESRGDTWLLLTLFLAVGLIGCGPEDDRTIRIWHEKVSAERALFEEVLARYEAEHGVDIETIYRDGEEQRQLYIVAAIGGSGPDLIYGRADDASLFAVTETIRPLETVFDDAYFDAFTERGLVAWGGDTLMVSDQVRTFLALVYNRDLVETPPETLDDLVALGEQLEDDDVRYALTWNYKEPYFFIPFLTAFGGWVMDDDGTPTLDTDATAEAIQYVLDLRDEYGLIPPEVDYNVSETLFKDGEAATIINGPWAFAGYGEAGVDYGVARIPRNEATGRWAAPIVSTSGYAINANVSDEKLPLVRDLLRYLTSAEVQTLMAERLRAVPTQRAVLTTEAVQTDSLILASLRQIEVARPMPLDPMMRQVWDGMRGPYQLVMNGRVTPREGARLMQEQVEKLIADSQL
jgi:maltose-binding protein MalE